MGKFIMNGIPYGGGDVEANPSGTATDTLTKLGIEGTVYEIQGGGGGSNGGAAYTEVVLWSDTNGATSPSNVALIDDLSNYDAIYIVHASNAEPAYRSSQIIPVSSIDKTGANRFGVYDTGANSYYYTVLNYTDDTHLLLDGWGSSYPIKYYKIVGIKYGGNLSPIIYSTEEREVGVWTDNKPLYAKVIDNLNVQINTTSWLTIANIPDGENLVDFRVFGDFAEQYVISDFYEVQLDSTNGDLNIHSENHQSRTIKRIYVQYTKTTDTAGSGEYNTLGIPNVHYTTDEQVIGTWLGETLYRRVYDFSSNPITIPANAWSKVANDWQIQPIRGTAIVPSSRATFEVAIDCDNNDGLYVRSWLAYSNVEYIIVEYTKTS